MQREPPPQTRAKEPKNSKNCGERIQVRDILRGELSMEIANFPILRDLGKPCKSSSFNFDMDKLAAWSASWALTISRLYLSWLFVLDLRGQIQQKNIRARQQIHDISQASQTLQETSGNIIYFLRSLGEKNDNVGRRLVSSYPIVRLFPKLIGYPVNGGGGPLLWYFFLRSFFQERIKTPQNARFPQKIVALLNPYSKNSTQTIFQGSTPWVTQILNNVIVWMVLYCARKVLGWKKQTLCPPSLSKAGPLTFPWYFYWIAMLFLWDCYGIYYGFLWDVYDSFMRLPWDSYWIPLGFPWYFYAISMGSL